MKRKTASTIICQNFKIPHQTIFQDYKCSYKSSLTYFGRLYIGEQHVCFIANMFGILKKCVIQIQKIQKIHQPSKNCLSIEEKQDGFNTIQYNFSGFKTDHAYILIKALWKKQIIQSQILNANDDQQNFSSLVPNQVNKQKLIDEGNVQSSFFNLKAIQADKQKLCQFQLPCSVQQFYSFFLADNATVYPRKKHIQLRDCKQCTVTPWRKSQQLESDIRQVAAYIRVVGVPFMNYAHLNQVWRLKKNQSNQLFVQFVTQMADVPYSNYFVVNNYLQILRDGDKKCKMFVDASIVFSKSTYMKNTILTRTFADIVDDYNFWFAQVKAILQKMKKTQDSQSSTKGFKSTKLNRQSSNIQFQSNDISTIESEGALNLETHLKKKKGSQHAQTDGQISKLKQIISKLMKIVIVLLILAVVQLIMNGFILMRISQQNSGQAAFFTSGSQSDQSLNQN